MPLYYTLVVYTCKVLHPVSHVVLMLPPMLLCIPYDASNVSGPASRIGASFFVWTPSLLQPGFEDSGAGLCCRQGQGKETRTPHERAQG